MISGENKFKVIIGFLLRTILNMFFIRYPRCDDPYVNPSFFRFDQASGQGFFQDQIGRHDVETLNGIISDLLYNASHVGLGTQCRTIS